MARGQSNGAKPSLPTGMAYGERSQAEAIQRSLPPSPGPTVPAPATGQGGSAVTPPAGVPPSPVGTPGPPLPDPFGPTDRPSEDPTAGIGPDSVETTDPEMLLRYLYSVYPHPDIARLISAQNAP